MLRILFLRHAASRLARYTASVLVACAWLGAAADGAHVADPLFKSYSVPLHKIIKFAPTKMPRSGFNWKMRDYLRFSDEEHLNFADKYTFFEIDCGTSCLEFSLIDRKTGIVHPGWAIYTSPPIDYKGPLGFIYRRNSRLLVVYRAVLGLPVFEDYYVWNGVKFILLKTDKIQE